MIIINLKGGLGNQMFQYALGYCLSKKKEVPLLFDLRLMNEHKINPSPRNVPRDFDLDIFNIKKKVAKKSDLFMTLQFFDNYRLRKYISIILGNLNLFCFYEKNRIFNKKILNNNNKNLYLDGLWQSEKYFKDYRKDILKLYNFDSLANKNENTSFLNKIDFNNSVCLNVRRADFLINPEHNVVTLDYYKNAISEIEKKINSGNINYYIFSDDIEWCKKNFKFIKTKHFVEHAYAGYKFYNYLYLMSCFKFFIIPNSTFAWWAAWLSTKENKVVMVPERWSGLISENLIDIVPPSWFKIKFL